MDIYIHGDTVDNMPMHSDIITMHHSDDYFTKLTTLLNRVRQVAKDDNFVIEVHGANIRYRFYDEPINDEPINDEYDY